MQAQDGTELVKGQRVKAFHPYTVGVVKYGEVVAVGRKYCRVDFGPLGAGIVRVAPRDVLEVQS